MVDARYSLADGFGKVILTDRMTTVLLLALCRELRATLEGQIDRISAAIEQAAACVLNCIKRRHIQREVLSILPA